MKYLNKNWNPEWLVNINGNRLAETKSIGYKWVRYRTSKWENNHRTIIIERLNNPVNIGSFCLAAKRIYW